MQSEGLSQGFFGLYAVTALDEEMRIEPKLSVLQANRSDQSAKNCVCQKYWFLLNTCKYTEDLL